MSLKPVLATFALLVLTVATPVQATVIGVAVQGNGSSTPVGSTNSDGSINFYALLNGSATYGVSGGGLSPDSCTIGWFSSTCTGGTLDMWLRFAPVTPGANTLTLQFTDLDLFGVNDPSYFLESVRILDSTMTSLAYVNQATAPEVLSANFNQQTLSLGLNVTGGSYFSLLRFRTSFVGAPRGTHTNTPERLLATLTGAPVSVPEPATLSLLGAGLLVLGLARRRKAAGARATIE